MSDDQRLLQLTKENERLAFEVLKHKGVAEGVSAYHEFYEPQADRLLIAMREIVEADASEATARAQQALDDYAAAWKVFVEEEKAELAAADRAFAERQAEMKADKFAHDSARLDYSASSKTILRG